MITLRPTLVRALLAAGPLALAACQSQASNEAAAERAAAEEYSDTLASEAPAEEVRPYDGLPEDETLRFTGTEPFWGGQVTGRTLRYETPENPSGETIEVERFAGRGGVSFSGRLAGQAFDMTVTPLSCSDGMSDRTYPFTVTLKIGDETRNGCGSTDKQPFEGPEHP
jgi:uncharacterized membrane protein